MFSLNKPETKPNYINQNTKKQISGSATGKKKVNSGQHYFNINRDVVTTPFMTRERTIETATI